MSWCGNGRGGGNRGKNRGAGSFFARDAGGDWGGSGSAQLYPIVWRVLCVGPGWKWYNLSIYPKIKTAVYLDYASLFPWRFRDIEQGLDTDDLGNDNPSKSTKSLRSVSILKLRKILERIDTVEVLFNANRYILQLSEDVYCDYLACLDWLKDKRVRTQPDFEYFYDIISKGEVFKGESFDWMDDFKSYICNSTVDVLSRFIDTYSIEDEADRVIQIADRSFWTILATRRLCSIRSKLDLPEQL